MKRRKHCAAAVFVLFILLGLSPLGAAQEHLNRTDNREILKNIRISSLRYINEGQTSKKALNKVLQWDFEKVFPTEYDLNAYLQQKRQQLINKKIFQSVLTEYRKISGSKPTTGITEVEVTLSLKEGWNILPYPIYKYDNNLGSVIGLDLDYKNVGGSLTDFYFSGYYSIRKSEFTFDWFKVRTGPFLLDVRFNQLWETIRTADSTGRTNLEYSYIQSLIQLSLDVPLMSRLSYKVRPILRWPYAYDFIMNHTEHSRDYYMNQGLVPAYNHILKWNKVDWIGSLRRGSSASLENQVEYDQIKRQFNTWIEGIIKVFIYFPYINYNTRLSAFWYYNDFKRNAGDRLRGILDYKMSGTMGFFWNQNFPFNVVSIPKWGELQLSPFVDMGFILSGNTPLAWKNMKYTAGVSLIVFPAALPSFSFNLDLGINLQNPAETEFRMSSLLYF